jgi:hypothetical protein
MIREGIAIGRLSQDVGGIVDAILRDVQTEAARESLAAYVQVEAAGGADPDNVASGPEISLKMLQPQGEVLLERCAVPKAIEVLVVERQGFR